MLKKILILFGGKSFEHDISLKSVNFVIENIKQNYTLVGIDKDGEWYETKNTIIDKNWKNNIVTKVNNIIEYLSSFDIVFPVIHGSSVEDGKLQSMFELFNIKYVGSNSYSSLVSYDKILTKLILEKYSIPQVPYLIYNKNMDFNKIEYPVIVKPAKCGSSIGISVCKSKGELVKAIKLAEKYDNNILIEKYLQSTRELECAIIEKNKKTIVSDVGEILKKEWYSYDEKYEKETETAISDIEQNIKDEIRQYSKKIFEILGCKDLSRVDFLYDLDCNKLFFNEINTMPGLTNISMFPKLINECGIKNDEIIDVLLNL